ncbi:MULTISPECIES: hypothetical protein [Bacillaceae]|uniref:hypothetical protein n=1 Tax=Bacillaceae TaxID=186817 RepID=UPI000B33A917|nr:MULTISPECIES: hypothetical protein [Bacillaceae]UOE94344.1 hypothetical protein MM271_01245 [Alkalihalobacillus sp. LMS39]
MEKLKYLNDRELEQVKQLQEKMNEADTYNESKKYITEITLIIEKARIRYMENRKKEIQ